MNQSKVWPKIIAGALIVVLPTVVGMTWSELPQAVGISVIVLCCVVSLAAAVWGVWWQPKWEKGWRPEWLQACLSVRVAFYDARKRRFVPTSGETAAVAPTTPPKTKSKAKQTGSSTKTASVGLDVISQSKSDALRAIARGGQSGDDPTFNQHVRPVGATLGVFPTAHGYDFELRVKIENRSRLKMNVKIRDPKWEVCGQSPQAKSERYSSSDCDGKPNSQCTFRTGKLQIYEPPNDFAASISLKIYFGGEGRVFFDKMIDAKYVFTVTGFREFVAGKKLPMNSPIPFEGVEVEREYLTYFNAENVRQDG
ncbi:hypothetical protein [Maricaulis maris]|nr:hypothetical protein [Maricaulis maris]